ncbi:DUF4224 domain-containing protein [Trinickia violacea]|uniref:DUF4224 domain-containing protein n=1 Tax=Trinickia violacea TaxID=2571746 RepID=A0A4P8IQB2_9BURK|nr:DUF4224 domain-containing protein [Trinickia violacea]QCP50197.1 DUF4224 domain-containing protein [Trinickia violacea]
MSEHLMDAADLERVTGKKRYSKQAEWFKASFGIDVVRCADGTLIMTWAQFDALLAKKSGTAPAGNSATVELCYD